MPYDAWFVTLEQPQIRLFGQPGLLVESGYLERFGFLPSPKTVHTDQATLRRFGYSDSPDAPPAPASVAGLRPTPVGFARLTGVTNPGTGLPQADMIGLTCAACHTGSIRYNGVSVRFDGGPGMVELTKLESVTGLSILYTLKVPGRFGRFATRVLGPNSGPAEYNKLKSDLTATGAQLLSQKNSLDKAVADNHQKETEEGFGRLDALNRIGNQVFATDLALSGLTGFEKNLHARDAPVSFPPIWTVPWFLFAQYDASIQQPLIRNAGEALAGLCACDSFSLVGRARESRTHRSDAARPQPVRPAPDRLRRVEAAEMAVVNFPRRSGMEDRSGARIARPRHLCRDLRRVPPWTGR